MTLPVPVALAVALVASLLAAAPATAAERSSGPSDEQTYLVVSTESSQNVAPAQEAALEAGGEVVEVFDGVDAALAEMTTAEAATLAAVPGTVVALDTPMSVLGPAGRNVLSRQARSWGLDRIDQRSGNLDGRYRSRPGIDGSGVHVYVIDTGLAPGRADFAGRVGTGRDFVGDGRGVADCHGHGTHIAGTIASRVAGVAPGAVIHPVRIADCAGGSTAGAFLAALSYVASVAPRAAVVNASMGGRYNAAVNAAVANLVKRGTPVVVAAGNSAEDARSYSPASEPSATTVAASTRDDRHAAYSNGGPAIDVYAPGTGITSTSLADPSRLVRASGTSMAAPHVAGYLALYFDRHPRASSARAVDVLLRQSTTGALRGVPAGTANRLVHTYGVALRAKVAVKAVGNRSRVRVDVNPGVGARSWRILVQRKTGGTFTTVRKVRTRGPAEVATVNVRRGTYRVVVPAEYGYTTKVSRTVFVRR
jgi:subtilisin family serine protease